MRQSHFMAITGGLLVFALGITAWQILSFRVPEYVRNPPTAAEIQLKAIQGAIKLDRPLTRAIDPIIGNPAATLAVVEFADFQCTYCAETAANLREIAENFPDQVKIIWKDAPDQRAHPQAMNAALAARCASEQGAFAQYHDALFANQKNLGPALYGKIAADLNLNTGEFEQCFSTKKWQSAIEANITEAVALGIDGTPYLFIGDERVTENVSRNELKKIIDRSLQK